MKISEFIQTQIFLRRIEQSGVLVVYNPFLRYHDLCLELASEKLRVIDASDSSISSRAAALAALQVFGQPNPPFEGILVYVPSNPPLTDEEKQRDPFSIYGACGSVFPQGDGDEYLSLCLKARADYATEIRRIFASDPNPSFAVIDAVGGGAGWPNLQARLGVESPRDILFVLLTPSPAQLEALKAGVAGTDAWANEVRALCQSTLGLKFLTKINSWSSLADELWRFLLFSEFVFDLPGDLPVQLENVPIAPHEAQLLVEDLCDRLRNDRRTQAYYIERAETIEKELLLPSACKAIDDFGFRDTFPFEERACFTQAVEALKRDNVEKLIQILNRHAKSVWTGRGENQIQWVLIQSAAALIQSCDDAEAQLSEYSRTFDALVNYYVGNLRDVDRLQREFEQAAGDPLISGNAARDVINHVRVRYRKWIDRLHSIFMRHLEQTGWPLVGMRTASEVFDKVIAPKLTESGRKVVVFLIDALRYELGIELAKQLDGEGQVEIQAACAQFPTVTSVGMASLLPGAAQSLKLLHSEDKIITSLDNQSIMSVTQRMEILRKRYGQRFDDLELRKFLKENFVPGNAVELLVIRTNEMDNDFESNPDAALTLVSRTLQMVGTAIHKLAGLGYKEAIIVTDHGFFLNTAIESGDVCAKPSGNWINMHERMFLGDGLGDLANLVMSAVSLGIRGDFNQVAMPRSMVAYRDGLSYFHGGASLQEAIIPVISVRIRVPEDQTEAQLTVILSYKHGAKKITTRVPVIEISVAGQSSFLIGEESLDIMLEAYSQRGKVVGEAKPGGSVNPATRMINIRPGETLQVTLRMDPEFEGKFSVKAINPTTLTASGKPLELETDYTV